MSVICLHLAIGIKNTTSYQLLNHSLGQILLKLSLGDLSQQPFVVGCSTLVLFSSPTGIIMIHYFV